MPNVEASWWTVLFCEAWANLFLFFVYETRFFVVSFCFVKLRQTAGIVNDMYLCHDAVFSVKTCTCVQQIKRDWKASTPMFSWKINYLLTKELFWVLSFRYLLFMNSCRKSLIICDTTNSLTISFFLKFYVWIAMPYAFFSLKWHVMPSDTW